MENRNFIINKKDISKIVSYILAGSIAASTLTGCESKRDPILKGTILESTSVVTFEDGTKDIVLVDCYCTYDVYNHYYSVISGEYFCSNKCETPELSGSTHQYEIINEEDIVCYLTALDVTKAMRGELSEDDIVDIVNRVLDSTEDITNNKTR